MTALKKILYIILIPLFLSCGDKKPEFAVNNNNSEDKASSAIDKKSSNPYDAGDGKCLFMDQIFNLGESINPDLKPCLSCKCLEAGKVQCESSNCEDQAKLCGSVITETPCKATEICKTRLGDCNPLNYMGECTQRPGICPFVERNVCSCDDKSIFNECFATLTASRIKRVGPCGEVRCQYYEKSYKSGEKFLGIDECSICLCNEYGEIVCETNEDECEKIKCGGVFADSCPKFQYCKFPTYTCGENGEEGYCTPRPISCPIDLSGLIGRAGNNVCACNNRSYDSPCLANFQLLNVRKKGRCE